MNCKNPRCREQLHPFSRRILCPACAYLARWMFGAGCFTVGALYGLWRIVRFFFL